jgi:hypothetical protein
VHLNGSIIPFIAVDEQVGQYLASTTILAALSAVAEAVVPGVWSVESLRAR